MKSGGWAKEEVSRLLISSETGLTASHLAHLALHNSQVITNFRSFLQLWLCLDFGLGLCIFRLVSETHGVEIYFQFKSHELHQDHLAISKSTPLDCKSFSKLKNVKMLPDQIRPSNNLCFSWWLWLLLITLSWKKIMARSFHFFLLFPNMCLDLERCDVMLIVASMYHLWWLGGISEQYP